MFERTGSAGLLDAMRDAQAAERCDTARRLLAMGRFAKNRLAEAGDEHGNWCVDDWEAVAAEIGAGLSISRGRASAQMNQGVALLDRLPRLAEVFAAGAVDHRVITAIVYRNALIVDQRALAEVDRLLAEQAPHWNARSRDRVAELVDWIVIHHDPDAVRAARQSDVDRHFEIEPGANGMAQVYGSIRAAAAAALDNRLDAMAMTVCRRDPRTKTQRRVDALEVLVDGGANLPCRCDTQDCGAESADTATTPTPAPPSSQIVIHVLAEQATLDGSRSAPALVSGYGAMPAEAARDLAARATIRRLESPRDRPVEERYRPSCALADFVRARDLTCRFPGCDQPAQHCDIDHTVAYPVGPTHPSNLKLMCRTHHLLKTFYTGTTGWSERQYPNGTITWTSPAGREYTTSPLGAQLFPALGASRPANRERAFRTPPRLRRRPAAWPCPPADARAPRTATTASTGNEAAMKPAAWRIHHRSSAEAFRVARSSCPRSGRRARPARRREGRGPRRRAW